MNTKENDLFLNILSNPTFSIQDFQEIGLNSSNTGIESEDYYKNNSHVQEKFKLDNGTFDEASFHKAYQVASGIYNIMSNQDYEDSLIKQASYHRDNIFAPVTNRREDADLKLVELPNPLRQQNSIVQLGRLEDPKLSISEIAQTQKVYDPATGKWHDSPNDSFFTDFWDTRVLAQWDEDGEHVDPVTGDLVKHQKGELKLNDNGTYYYENLDGRSVYGRQVLNKMDTLTTDGSFWNKYDFFDSDDADQKSIGGSLLKNLALVGSMFIGGGVGTFITGLSVAQQSASLLATLGKMFLGSDNETLSSIEGWTESISRNSQTDYAKNNTLCWENFINLIGDVAGQLKEQRFIFKEVPSIIKPNLGKDVETQEKAIAKWLEKANKNTLNNIDELIKTKSEDLIKQGKEALVTKSRALQELNVRNTLDAQSKLDSYIKGYNKLGEVLSKGYMTAVTVQDTYGEAKQAGATDLEATMLTLGYAAGEAWLLNTGIGEHILPELKDEGFRNRSLIRALAGIKKEYENSALKTKKDKLNFIKNVFNKGKDIAVEDYTLGKRLLPSMFAHAAGEGIEEVSEEVLADFSKSCFNVTQWLQGDDTRLSAWDNIPERYGMSLFGGAIGGAINAPFIDYKPLKDYQNMSYNSAIQNIIYDIKNGKIDSFLKTLDSTKIGNPNIQIQNSDGSVTIYNQDKAMKDAIKKQVQFISDILSSEGCKISDESFLANQTKILGDIRFNSLYKATTAGRFLQEFNTLNSKIVDLNLKLQDLEGTPTDLQKRQEEKRKETKTETTEDSIKNKEREKLEKDLQEVIKQKDALLNGDRSAEFIEDTLFELSPISQVFTTPTFIQYAEFVENKKINEISKERQKELKEKFLNWKNTEAKDDIHFKSQLFLNNILAKANPVLDKISKSYAQDTKESRALNNIISNIYTNLNVIPEENENWADTAQLEMDQNNSYILQSLGELIDPKIISNQSKILNKQLKEAKTDKEKQQLLINYRNNLTDLVLNNIGKIVEPILQQKYVNYEVQQGLINLIRGPLQKYLNIKRIQTEDFLFGNTDQDKKLQETAVQLSNYVNKLRQLPNTPIEQQLDEFSYNIIGKGFNFQTLYNSLSENLYKNSENISEFSLDDKTEEALDEAINLIKLYKTVVSGAKLESVGFNTSLDEEGNLQDSTDFWGYSKTINDINKKAGTKDWKDLTTLDTETANAIISDLNTLANKLIFSKKLYNVNTGQKLNTASRTNINTSYLLYNRLNKFIINIPKEWKGKEDLLGVINSLEILKQNAKDKNFKLDLNQKEEVEKETLKLQDSLFDFFNQNQDKLSNIEELSKFLISTKLNLLTKVNNLLDDNLKDVDDNSFIWWLASRAAIKSSNFYSQYRQIINDKIAPVPSQELATYLNYASVIKGDIISNFFKAYRKAIIDNWSSLDVEAKKKFLDNLGLDSNTLTKEENNNLILSTGIAPYYQNLVLTEGIPGSGKTTAVFRSTIELLKKFNKSFLNQVLVVHGVSKEQGEQLKKDLGLEKATVMDKDEFLKYASNDYKPYKENEDGSYEIPESDYYVNSLGDIKSSLPINSISNPPTLIITDEISKFNSLQLDIFDKFCRKYGIAGLVAGDFDQTGATGTYKVKVNGEVFEYNMKNNRESFPRTFKLGMSMRTANIQKTLNLKYFQALIQNGFKGSLNLHYYQDENGSIFGDKLYALADNKISDVNLISVQKDIDSMIKNLKEGEKIGYVWHSKDTQLYKILNSDKYKDHINFFYGGSAQGLEGNYYIIENDPKKDIEEYIHDLYTGVSRSKIGSIVIAPSSVQNVVLTSVQDNYTKLESIGNIKKFSDRRKQILEKIISDNAEIEASPRTKEEVDKDTKLKTINKETLPEGVSDEDQWETQKEDINNNNEEEEEGKGENNESQSQENYGIPDASRLLPSKSSYKKNLSDQIKLPIVDMSTKSEEEYKKLLDNTMEEDDDIKKNQVGKEKKNPTLNIIAYSASTFETGVLHDSQDNVIQLGTPERYNARIDNINGLIKVDALQNKDKRKYSEYLELLGKLRSPLLSIENKEELVNTLQYYLGLKDIYLTFAFKSTSRKKDSEFNVDNPNFYKFSHSPEEQLEFMYSNDTRSKEVIRKSLVAIVGTEENGDLLEISLLTLTSPITLIKLKEGKEFIFPEANKIYNETKGGEYDRLSAIINNKEINDLPEYSSLLNFIKLYLYTGNSVFYIDKNIEDYKTWTPAQNMEQLGPQLATSKGSYTSVEGFSYTWDWLDLSELQKNPSLNISPILSSDSKFIKGYPTKVVQAGHPFILVSSDNTIGNLGEYYTNQLVDPQNYPRKVKLIYVLPPKASLSEYIDNLYKIINQKGVGSKPIGNQFTSYHILSELIKDSRFEEHFGSLFNLDFIKEKIKEVDDKEGVQNKAKVLLAISDWSEIGGLSNYSLSQQFDGFLKSLVYVPSSNITYQEMTKNEENLNLLQDILKDSIPHVYYTAQLPASEKRTTYGPFFVIKQDKNYKIDNKSFQIHGKIDSPAFRFNVTPLLDSFLGKLVKSKEGNEYSKDNYRYLKNNSNIFKATKTNKYSKILNRLKALGLNSIINEVSIDNPNFLNEVLNKVNYNTGSIAIREGNNLFISDFQDIFKGSQILIKDNNGNTLEKLSDSIKDTSGKYLFQIITSSDNETIKYNAEFVHNDKETKLTITEQPTENTTTEVTTQNILVLNGLEDVNTFNAFKSVLGRMYKNISETEKFMQKLNTSIENPRLDIAEILEKNRSNYEQGSIGDKAIQELLNYIKAYRDQNNTKQKESCPSDIIIKF